MDHYCKRCKAKIDPIDFKMNDGYCEECAQIVSSKHICKRCGKGYNDDSPYDDGYCISCQDKINAEINK